MAGLALSGLPPRPGGAKPDAAPSAVPPAAPPHVDSFGGVQSPRTVVEQKLEAERLALLEQIRMLKEGSSPSARVSEAEEENARLASEMERLQKENSQLKHEIVHEVERPPPKPPGPKPTKPTKPKPATAKPAKRSRSDDS